jgi:hypothetical protein
LFDSFVRVCDKEFRKKLQCNDCRRATIHTLEARCVGESSEDVGHGHSVSGGADFSIYRCGACDSVCYETSWWNSEDYDHDEHGHYYNVRTEIQYPPPSSADFSFNTNFTPDELDEIIEEMIYALAGNKMKLATVALRMVIEFIVQDKHCSGRNLRDKIEDLFRQQLIDQTQLDLLHKIREKGNAGAHEMQSMNRVEMTSGIAIVNLLLEKLYNGPAREADIIRKATKAFHMT